jgi:predicted SAM-dependent methyltransferase
MESIINTVNSENLYSTSIQDELKKLSLFEREYIALKTHTMVQYYGEEVALVKKAEEDSVLKAAPLEFELELLNGLNVGCGDRIIHPSLLGVDIHKGKWSMGHGSQQEYTSFAHLLSWSSNLPFQPESIDYIVGLHILEHESDPIACVIKWLEILRPGGGIGLILPDWRYTWDARNDNHPWSHRWNPTPSLIKSIFNKYWSKYCLLENVDTYTYKLSFDVILRKHGVFKPFSSDLEQHQPTGAELFRSGKFLSDPL